MPLSDRDRKVLWARARNVCAFPQCRQVLIEDQADTTTGEVFATPVGEEAHIHSASPDGPRYDTQYPLGKLETYDNRILVCRVHHRLIDAEKGRAYDAETLVEMKRRHEQQQARRERISRAIQGFLADQFGSDDRVLFRQVKLDGPSVDSMFVDVPFAARVNSSVASLLEKIAVERPGDAGVDEGFVVTGAAQALLHPEWSGNALVVGGPGQGKSTLLQYVCQFHRSRQLGRDDYSGCAQGLEPVTAVARVPIRVDLRRYAQWARSKAPLAKQKGKKSRAKVPDEWLSLEEYVVGLIARASGGHKFTVQDLSTLVSTEAVLLALDGLDEVANLADRDKVGDEIVRTNSRLRADAADLVVLVATRPGIAQSDLWSSAAFPVCYLQKLTAGLRLQYLQRWTKVAELNDEAAAKLQRTFVEHESSPHIRDLASYPMQLAILLHLLQRRGLLPQERTDLYSEYVKTFLDREETEEKEPLLSSEREVIEDIHAFLGWYLQVQTEGGKTAGQVSRAELRRLINEHLDGREQGKELAKRLFSAIEGRVLCLIERESGYYEFEVQSLREYFAAAYLNEYSDPRGTGGNSRVDCFDALLERPYWLNVCRFFVGMFTKIEVRGIHQSLRHLSERGDIGAHPHLRLAAGRLLDDRAYQGQPDATIKEVVDFVLAGQGVVLADDGFLDESGRPLTFSEGAGRSQVVLHAKSRLLDPALTPGTRHALARTLARHATDGDNVSQWIWSQFAPTENWLATAAALEAIENPTGQHATKLAEAVATVSTDQTWMGELLMHGGYQGSTDAVLSICKSEINDGAAEVLEPDTTALGRMVEAARVAQVRTPPTMSGAKPGPARTRYRRLGGRAVALDLANGTNALRAPPEDPSAVAAWASRLRTVFGLWGDGWVLRQAIAALPSALDLDVVALNLENADALLVAAVTREAGLRANRGDTVWWRNDFEHAASVLDRRMWLYSALTAARAQVVIDCAKEIDAVAADLAPKHFRSLETAIEAFAQSPLKQKMFLHEPLRLGKVSYSARALWLLRGVVTDGSRDQVDKRLVPGFADLLTPGMGDRRAVIRIVGTAKTIKIQALKGTRDVVPPGAWAGDVKLGAISSALAKDILTSPGEWPVEVVGRAIQQAAQTLNRLASVASIAKASRWFDIPAKE